uniref:Uncharacterized protein n=1 Tax=Sphaerodactylus townsendi TaxID=933632 RepID=A0ACB8FYV0_9SAUR
MAWILIFLTFLTYLSGVSSQPPWIQPPSASVSLGQTAKLSCTVNSDGNYVYWHQQKSGQAPRYLHCAECSRGEGIPDRFTASVSGNVGYLTITNVQADDEADYYCVKWRSNQFHSVGIQDDWDTWFPKEDLERQIVIIKLDLYRCIVGTSTRFLMVLRQKREGLSQILIYLRKTILAHRMALALVLLILLSYNSGVDSRSPWTQPASKSAAPGETCKLSCTVNNDGNTIYWYQQRTGEAPRFVHCTGCSSRGDGIPNRFTASTSGNVGYLTITNVHVGDEADYYCSMWSSTDSMRHSVLTPTMARAFFLLTLLSYWSGATSQPTLTQPPSEAVALGQMVKLSCTVSSDKHYTC